LAKKKSNKGKAKSGPHSSLTGPLSLRGEAGPVHTKRQRGGGFRIRGGSKGTGRGLKKNLGRREETRTGAFIDAENA